MDFTEDRVGDNAYVITLTASSKTYKVEFKTTPADAKVQVWDSAGAEVVGSNNAYELKAGETYKYTVSAEGYDSRSGDIIPGEDFTEDRTGDNALDIKLQESAKTYAVEFKLSPDSAKITVTDESGKTVESENGIYKLKEGVLYTYKVTADGYDSKSGDLIPGLDFTEDCVGENAISIELKKSKSSSSDDGSSIWDGKSVDTEWAGDGTGDSPYLIQSAAELAGLAENVNKAGPGNTAYSRVYFKLTIDLDLSGYEWTSIGGGEAQCGFGGHFDGGGHIISGLYIRSTANWTEYTGRNRGLFGIIDAQGVVENVGVYGYVYAQRSVGGIAGKNSGTIRGCFNAADIYATDSKGVGGIVGANWNNGTVTDCYNVGSVTSTYISGSAGGIAGENEYRIERCYSVGTVKSPFNAGGIVGSDKHTGGGASAGAVGTGVCYDCYYLTGTVIGEYAGGIGFEAADAENTVYEVDAETLRGVPEALNRKHMFKKAESNVNDGYPLLKWQDSSTGGSSDSSDEGGQTYSFDGDTILLYAEVEHSEGGMTYGTDATLTKEIAEEWVEKADDKSKVKLWVEIEDSNRLVLIIETEAVKLFADAEAGLQLGCSRGLIRLDSDAVVRMSEANGEARITISYDDWNDKTRLSVTVNHQIVDVTMKVELPATDDIAAVFIVNGDGSLTVIRKSAVVHELAYADVPSGTTVQIIGQRKFFYDVKAEDWFADAVYFVYTHELMMGVDKRAVFAPNDPMTRAMLVTVLYRLEDEPECDGSISFSDVIVDSWYAAAVDWAAENGIVLGNGVGFAPNDNITREQIATILYRYAQFIGLDTSEIGDVSSFKDGDKVSSWAQEAMAWAVKVGLFKGDDTGKLNPQGNATRAEVATLLMRLVKLIVVS